MLLPFTTRMLSRHFLLAFRPVAVWLLRRANLLKVASLFNLAPTVTS